MHLQEKKTISKLIILTNANIRMSLDAKMKSINLRLNINFQQIKSTNTPLSFSKLVGF